MFSFFFLSKLYMGLELITWDQKLPVLQTEPARLPRKLISFETNSEAKVQYINGQKQNYSVWGRNGGLTDIRLFAGLSTFLTPTPATCTRTHAHTHPHMHLHLHTYAHAHLHVHVPTHAHARTCTHTHREQQPGGHLRGTRRAPGHAVYKLWTGSSLSALMCSRFHVILFTSVLTAWPPPFATCFLFCSFPQQLFTESVKTTVCQTLSWGDGSTQDRRGPALTEPTVLEGKQIPNQQQHR